MTVAEFPAHDGPLGMREQRAVQLLDLLAACMRCPGHEPGMLEACQAAAAAGVPVHAPPCSRPDDCSSAQRLWKHYCKQHYQMEAGLEECEEGDCGVACMVDGLGIVTCQELAAIMDHWQACSKRATCHVCRHVCKVRTSLLWRRKQQLVLGDLALAARRQHQQEQQQPNAAADGGGERQQLLVHAKEGMAADEGEEEWQQVEERHEIAPHTCQHHQGLWQQQQGQPMDQLDSELDQRRRALLRLESTARSRPRPQAPPACELESPVLAASPHGPLLAPQPQAQLQPFMQQQHQLLGRLMEGLQELRDRLKGLQQQRLEHREQTARGSPSQGPSLQPASPLSPADSDRAMAAAAAVAAVLAGSGKRAGDHLALPEALRQRVH